MTYIKENFPVLLSPKFWGVVIFPVLRSPKFWGVVITATIVLFLKEGWISEAVGEWLATIAGAATGVGILDSIARKLGK